MIEKIELLDAELDSVCGGVFDFGNIVAQGNTATQVGVALGGASGLTFGNAGNAGVLQQLGQANVSSIS